MKRKLASLILCLIFVGASFCFVGCKTKNYSKDDINELYLSLKTDEKTKDFFDNNDNLRLVYSENIEINDINSRNYFLIYYDSYLTSSSEFVADIINEKRVGSISYAVKDFKQSELNDIYNKLVNVKNAMINLSDSKFVFELSDGLLHFKGFLDNYNSLIESLYKFNESFANYYFNGVGKFDFSLTTTNLEDNNCRDMINYQIMMLSKVSFNFELKSYALSSLIGNIANDVKNENKMTYIKDFSQLSNNLRYELNIYHDIAQTLDAFYHYDEVKNIFSFMQLEQNQYNKDYELFLKALKQFDICKFLNSTNRQAYIEESSNKQKSIYNVINNFFQGKHGSYINGLSIISDDLYII